MKELSKGELQELLVKCWMTHDGMWFYHCVQAFGIEKANQLNQAALRSLAVVEVGRITRALGIKKEGIKTHRELREVIDGMFGIVKGDFMDFAYSFPSEDLLHWKMNRCFAYEGMHRMGVSDRYQCGLLYRVKCWVDVLGIECSIDPPLDGCIMETRGSCSGDVRFSL